MHSDSFCADIEIKLTNSVNWYGIGTLDKKISPGGYSTNIGEIMITLIREDLSFQFIGVGTCNLVKNNKNYKLNCWEFNNCSKRDTCPTYVEKKLDKVHSGKNAGRSCWVVAGTPCTAYANTFSKKIKVCENCEFYNKVKREEGSNFKVPTLLYRLQGKDYN
jgi:hypothetical protein